MRIGGATVEAVLGDITQQSVDAIVNAANSALAGGGGVDGAIHRAGGPAILAECREIVVRQGPLPTGRAVATTAGRLRARCVIHTVGPVYSGRPSDAELLASCHAECLGLTESMGLRSVAFPAISTGVYGYPLHEAARVAVGAVARRLLEGVSLELVRFVLFGPDAFAEFEAALSEVGPVSP